MKNPKLRKRSMTRVMISLIAWINLTGCAFYQGRESEPTYLETYFSDTAVDKSLIQHLDDQNKNEDGLVSAEESYCTAHSFNLVLAIEGDELLKKEMEASVLSDLEETPSKTASVLISNKVIDENGQKKTVLVTGSSADPWGDSLSLEIAVGDLTSVFTIPVEKADTGKEFSIQTPFEADVYMDVNGMILTSAGPQKDIHRIAADPDGKTVLYEKGKTLRNVTNYDELDNVFSFSLLFEEPMDVDGIDGIFVN